MYCVSLTIQALPMEDVYRDRVRIPVAHGGTIGEGRVCKMSVNGKSVLVEVRGIRTSAHEPEPGPTILMDEITRAKLLVLTSQTYQFEMKEVGWLGQFYWAWKASDPTPRIAARLGVVGLILGAIGVVIGVVALYR